jgi:membrane-associated phospholipid phosphatase
MWRGRRDLDKRLGSRLAVAAVATFLIAVPFALLLVLVKSSWNPLRRLDESTADRLHTYALGHPAAVRFFQDWSTIFGPTTWRLLVALLAIWLLYRRAVRLASWAIITITVGGLLGLTLKFVVNRARPILPDPVAAASGSSFPSLHSMNAALGVGVLVLAVLPVLGRGWRAGVWALGVFIVLITGYARIALGVHWVSDVLAGWTLGAGVVAGTAAAFESWRREAGRAPAAPAREGVEPEAAPDITPGTAPAASKGRH